MSKHKNRKGITFPDPPSGAVNPFLAQMMDKQAQQAGFHSRLLLDELRPSDYREQARLLEVEHDEVPEGEVCHCQDCQAVIPMLHCAARQIEQWDKDWSELLKRLARLSDAMGLQGEWGLADDETLLEQFDPWAVLETMLDDYGVCDE